jgi:hypothetical protein
VQGIYPLHPPVFEGNKIIKKEREGSIPNNRPEKMVKI